MRSGTFQNIYLNRLESNIHSLRSLIGEKKILFMVKAESYGHGLLPIAEHAVSQCQIKTLGVATLQEALELRRGIPDGEFDIYVFSDLGFDLDQGLESYRNFRLIPVISSIELLKRFVGSQDMKYVPLCLMLNTGMNRLGVEENQLNELIGILKLSGRTQIDHLMTHFSDAFKDENSDKKTIRQYQKFQESTALFKRFNIQVKDSSVSNSAAILRKIGLDESYVRPGLMLYGPSGMDFDLEQPWEGKNLSQLLVEVIQTRLVKANETVGYGSRQIGHEGLLVTLAMGYGDGLPTSMGELPLKVKNRTGHLVGRVSMDMCTAIFPNQKLGFLRSGDQIEFWNDSIERIEEVSKIAGLIPYEIFCGLKSRIQKRYRLS